MATLCHICGRPLHPFGFQPLPCLHLRASHGYRSVVWSDCLASLHSSSTGTLMVQVDHVMIHPAHRTCTSITCAPFRSSTYVPSIRILFRVSSRCIDGISLRWLRPWLWEGSKMQTVTPAVRKTAGQKRLGLDSFSSKSTSLAASVLWHKQPCSRHETGAQQLPRQARRSTRCVCTEILHTPAA